MSELDVGVPKISMEDWERAEPGDLIHDKNGNGWQVVENIGEDPSGHLLKLQSPDGKQEPFLMSDMMGGWHIFECDVYQAVPELNDPRVVLVKAP